MMDRKDIEKLAELSRVAISEEEKEDFVHDLESILGYVSKVSTASGETVQPEAGKVRNVFREDTDPNEPGTFTEKILSQAPERDGDSIKVRKIL